MCRIKQTASEGNNYLSNKCKYRRLQTGKVKQLNIKFIETPKICLSLEGKDIKEAIIKLIV
jgi:hypothetical protein